MFLVACGPTSSKCNTTNCGGCCDQMTDTCVAGTEATDCGAGGKLCVVCASGKSCGSGVCFTPTMVVQCSASNCDGCCDSGTCFHGVANEACGSAGASCQVCGSGKTCQLVNASSQFGGACN